MKRLGKERMAILELLNSIKADKEGKDYRWKNHPARDMWYIAGKHDYSNALVDYGIAVCEAWMERGYKDTCLEKIIAHYESKAADKLPNWLGRIETFTEKHKIKDFNRLDKRPYSRDIEHHIVATLNKTDDFDLKHTGSKGCYEAPFDAIDIQKVRGKRVGLRAEFKTLCLQKNGSLVAAHVSKHHNKIDYFCFFMNNRESDIIYVSKYQPYVTHDLTSRNWDSALFNKNGRPAAVLNYEDLKKCDKYIIKKNTIKFEKGDSSFRDLDKIYYKSENYHD